MFERIISINNNYAIVKISNNFNNDILNYNVIFEETNKKILGEINEVINFEAKISFLGEFIDNKFYSGIIRKPSTSSIIRIINQQELAELVGSINNKSFSFGSCPLYNNYPINIDINNMFGKHSLVIGNARVGKTNCAVKFIQNLFSMKDKLPFNSNIFIFSNCLDYKNTFENINKNNSGFNYKFYSIDNDDDSLIKIPLWLMDLNDFSNLFEVDNHFQINILDKMLNYVSLFSKEDENTIKYKNHIVASAIMRVMYSNQINIKVREQIFEILNYCSTKEICLNKEIPGIGYNKKFIKCFDLDKNGEFIERDIVTKYIQKFINNSYKINLLYEPGYFTLEQLEEALNFVLISEGILFNDKLYNDAIVIKDRLHNIINSRYREIFNVSNYITIEQFINSLIMVNNNARAQIVNFMIDTSDSNLANSFVKILCNIIYSYNKKTNGGLPLYMIFDNIDNYIKKDNDLFYRYNIFDKILKDGNKYSVNVSFIAKNVSNLDKDILACFHNYIVFKLNNESDLDYIKKYIPEIDYYMVEKIKSLQVGNCLIFGEFIKIPMISKIDLVNTIKNSNSLSIYDKWIVNFNK